MKTLIIAGLVLLVSSSCGSTGGGGAGGGSGGGGGSGACGPSNCPKGCCSGGVCDTGYKTAACGRGGGECVNCTTLSQGVCDLPNQVCAACTKPLGTYLGVAGRSMVVGGDGGSTYCPSEIVGNAFEFQNGSIVNQGNSPITGMPITFTTVYSNSDCDLKITAKSSGCAGTGTICRAFSTDYTLEDFSGVLTPGSSFNGKSLLGTMLMTLSSSDAGESCQATYDVSLSTP